MELSIPDELVESSGCSPQELRFELAVGLLMDGRLTLGQAARLAGLSKPVFLDELGRRRIPVPWDETDLAADAETLQMLSRAARPPGREGCQ